MEERLVVSLMVTIVKVKLKIFIVTLERQQLKK